MSPACPGKSYLVVFNEPSSGIFSSEQLLPESRSRCSSSLKRSATHWAVSRASGSWSQHSVRVSHTIWMPCSGREVTGMLSCWSVGILAGRGSLLTSPLRCRLGTKEPVHSRVLTRGRPLDHDMKGEPAHLITTRTLQKASGIQ